jgi:hypothetical protein
MTEQQPTPSSFPLVAKITRRSQTQKISILGYAIGISGIILTILCSSPSLFPRRMEA